MYLTLCIFIYKIHNALTDELLELFLSKNASEEDHHNKFSIYTNGCKIKKLDPMDVSIRNYITPRSPPLICGSGDADIVYQDGHWLRFNRTAMVTYAKFSHCAYKALYRQGDNMYSYKPDTDPVHDDILIKDEFIKVICFNNLRQEIYAKLFSFILG